MSFLNRLREIKRNARTKAQNDLKPGSVPELSLKQTLATLKVADAIETWRVHPKPHISSLEAFQEALSENKVRWFQLEKVYQPIYEPINYECGAMAIMTNCDKDNDRPEQLFVRWKSDSNYNSEGPAEHLFVFQNVDPELYGQQLVGSAPKIVGTNDGDSVLLSLLMAILFNPDKVGEENSVNPGEINGVLTKFNEKTTLLGRLVKLVMKRGRLQAQLSRITTDTAPADSKAVQAETLKVNEILEVVKAFFRRFPEDTEWHDVEFHEKYTRPRYINTHYWSEFHLLGAHKRIARYTRYMAVPLND